MYRIRRIREHLVELEQSEQLYLVTRDHKVISLYQSSYVVLVFSMRLSLLLVFIAVLFFIGLVSAYHYRLLTTLFLIWQTTPFERLIPEAPTILVLGDSTGYGTGVSDNNDSIAGLIGKDFSNYTILNNSVNGRTIGELVSVSEKINGNHKLILLQIGGNDILQKRDIEKVRAELRLVFQNLKSKTEHMVMMSSGNVGGASAFSGELAKEYETSSRSFREMFIAEATKAGVVYVDLFQEPENDVFIKEPEVYLAADGLHPSAAGYLYWYQTLLPALKALNL